MGNKLLIMYREIITANLPTFEIRIQDEMIGKKIEILAFEIDNETVINTNSSFSNADSLTKSLEGYRVDLSNFKLKS